MKKLLLLIVVVAAGGGLFYAKQQGLFDKMTGPSSAVDFTSHIPADTLFWVTNTTPIDTTVLSGSISDPNTELMLENLKRENDAPGIMFLADLATNWVQAAESGTEAIKQQWGFADTYSQAIYTVGIAPVFEFSLQNPAQFVAQIDKAASDAGITKSEQAQGVVRTSLYPLQIKEMPELALLVRQTANTVRISVDAPFSDDIKSLIKGDTFAANTLSNQNVLDALATQYQFTGPLLGALQFDNIANMFTNADSMAFKMLSTISKDEINNDFAAFQTKECHSEIAALVAHSPRALINGTIEVDGDRLTSDSTLLWEINNSWLAETLAKLNGVVPAFSLASDYNPMFGFAKGVDISQLSPTVIALWTAFNEQTFSCESLVDFQYEVKENDPSLALMATGMLSSVKGFSITLNDLDFEIQDDMPQLSQLSAVISLSSSAPGQLIALAQQFQPMLASINIPADGTPQPLPLPLPNMPELQVSIQNNGHIVVATTDDTAQKQVASLAKQDLANNGLMTMSVQSARFTQLLQKLQDSMDQNLLGGGTVDSVTCAELNLYAAKFKQQDMNLTLKTQFTEHGIETAINESQRLPQQGAQFSTGKYQVTRIDMGCTKAIDGEQVFNADNTGILTSKINQNECDGYASEYTWKRKGNTLVFNHLKEQLREDCAQPMGEWTVLPQDENSSKESCTIFNETDSSFSCVFAPEGELMQFNFNKI